MARVPEVDTKGHSMKLRPTNARCRSAGVGLETHAAARAQTVSASSSIRQRARALAMGQGRLNLVRIGRPMSARRLRRLGRRLGQAFGSLIGRTEVVDIEAPPVDSIDAALLTGTLDATVGGMILGVTDVDLTDGAGDDFFSFMFGGKDDRNRVAVVSTCRLGGRRRQTAFERTVKVALHEMGHNFGLGHHYAFVRAPDGAYCPMSKGDYNRYGERGYVRAVIDARGGLFCPTCRETMQRYALAHGQ